MTSFSRGTPTEVLAHPPSAKRSQIISSATPLASGASIGSCMMPFVLFSGPRLAASPANNAAEVSPLATAYITSCRTSVMSLTSITSL